MGNIVYANLARGRDITTSPLYQYDYGQILKFIGGELPEAYEVHFSNTLHGAAVTQIGNADGVSIPDIYLTTGQAVYAWLFLHSGEEDGETEKTITIPVIQKAKATDAPPTPVQQSAIAEAIAALNTAVNDANEAIAHYPRVEDGYWYVWDVLNGEYVSTGVQAEGEDGYSPTVNIEAITGGHRVTITDKDGDHAFDVMDGEPGEPGVSPEITVSDITGGHRITIVDVNGTKTVDVMDGGDGRGIVSVTKTGTAGLVDTYTIVYTEGENSTFTVTNGEDGVSPTITVSEITGGHRITITDKNHPSGLTVDVMDGQDGGDGRGIVSVEKTGTSGLTDTYTITYTSGNATTFTVTNGQPGTDGTSAYCYIRYAASQPTQDSDMKTTPDAWMGVYSGTAATAPTHYTDYTWYRIKGETGPVTDVQINGTSILSNGVANVKQASSNDLGVIKVGAGLAINPSNGNATTNAASLNSIKSGSQAYTPIVPSNQHHSTFYGLARASGDTTQSASSNAVGQYTEDAKSKISDMLNAPVTVSGSTPTITAKSGIQYVCGEVSTLTVVLPASGCVDVRFESGSTATVLTITPPSGVMAVKWANGFDPTSLEANTVYEINVMDGEYGVACAWT